MGLKGVERDLATVMVRQQERESHSRKPRAPNRQSDGPRRLHDAERRQDVRNHLRDPLDRRHLSSRLQLCQKYVVKTTLEVRRKNATKESLYVADQEDVDKEGAERRSRLAVLYCLLREEEIRECVFEMRNYLDAQKEKNSAEEYACLLPAGPHPWRLSEEDAIRFYDSCITSPVFEERNAVIRSFFVLVVQNSLNPFTLGTTISKLLINHATVQTINYEDRYSNLLIISEASPQKYRIVLNERSRSDLLAFINRTK
ncbi:hypothetical protein L596_018209 [Steinernema carpocapsae]|uniref:Uncharacterized protein n=1 Tax=Steinernema carpocapsae TaxID=34508 RepID=A0A4U5N4Q6_STECR|nr:hypothetical protein L596_018209 [Steinernema carpocapsae]